MMVLVFLMKCQGFTPYVCRRIWIICDGNGMLVRDITDEVLVYIGGCGNPNNNLILIGTFMDSRWMG